MKHSVVELINSKGEKVVRVMSKDLASHWRLKQLYVGEHLKCLDYISSIK